MAGESGGGGGGYDIGASLSFANSSGASLNSPFSLIDNSTPSAIAKPNNLVMYVIFGAFALSAGWLFLRK